MKRDNPDGERKRGQRVLLSRCRTMVSNTDSVFRVFAEGGVCTDLQPLRSTHATELSGTPAGKHDAPPRPKTTCGKRLQGLLYIGIKEK